MKFIKSLLIDLIFAILYYIIYKICGFEISVIVALAQIISHLVQKEVPKKTQPHKQLYVQPKTRMRF